MRSSQAAERSDRGLAVLFHFRFGIALVATDYIDKCFDESLPGPAAFLTAEHAAKHHGKDGEIAQLRGGQFLLALLIEQVELRE